MARSITDIEPWLEPELRAVFSSLPEMPLGDVSIARERDELEVLIPEAKCPEFSDRFAPGLPIEPDVRLRVYRPASAAPKCPALVWMHGGAFCVGVPEFDEHLLRHIAEEVGLVAVSVDYRLAPEHPFPAALLDCEATVRWLHDAAGELDVDPARICIGGSSAGATLAASLCLKLRDERGPMPAFQLLMYPALDDRLVTPSMTTIADVRTLTRDFLRERWRAYLGPDGDSEYAVPARAADLHGLPPALILAAELDPLRDEAVHYATRLWQAAGGCELHVLRGAVHGFDALVPETALARSTLSLMIQNLQRATATRQSQPRGGDRPAHL